MHAFGAEARGQSQAPRVEVHRQHAAAVRPQGPDREQSDQPRTEDGEPLAQGRLGQTCALQRHGPEHGERGLLVGDRLGDPRAEGMRRLDHLGMGAVGNHAVPAREAGDAGAGLEHHAGVAISERQRLIQPGAHSLQRGQPSIGARLLPNQPDLLRLLPRFGQQAGAAELDQHPLGPRRDQARPGADQQVRRQHPRAGYLDGFHRARSQLFEHLLHRQSPRLIHSRWAKNTVTAAGASPANQTAGVAMASPPA